MILTARVPAPGAFASFGAFLESPAEVGDRSVFSDWLEPVPGLAQHCHMNRVAPSALPLTLNQVERHPHASQLFLPLDVSRYLVTVMPSDQAGAPDFGQARAFVVPGTMGVVYRPGTWHAGIAALDNEATFAVFMWRGGVEDDVFASIPPLEVHPGDSAQKGPAHG